jgi:hypothetical protein
MHTVRRVALVLISCVIASLAGACIWLGLAAGLAVGLRVGAVVIATYVAFLGPSQRRWGASDEEVRRAMPGPEQR